MFVGVLLVADATIAVYSNIADAMMRAVMHTLAPYVCFPTLLSNGCNCAVCGFVTTIIFTIPTSQSLLLNYMEIEIFPSDNIDM